MRTENLEKLMDRWIADSAFRDAVRSDMEGAVAASGVSLTQEELEAVRAVDWSAHDEELVTLFNNFVI